MVCFCCSFVLQSEEAPVAEAFFEVLRKENQFDMFSVNSGQRLGFFRPEGKDIADTTFFHFCFIFFCVFYLFCVRDVVIC